MSYFSRIRLIYLAGATVFLAIIWLDELFGLPQVLLGAPDTSGSWQSAAWESGLFLIISSLCLTMVKRAEKRIAYLEKLNVICSHCRRVKIDDQWIPLEQWLMQSSKVELSHGLCNHCLEELYPDRFEQIMQTSEIHIDAKTPKPQ